MVSGDIYEIYKHSYCYSDIYKIVSIKYLDLITVEYREFFRGGPIRGFVKISDIKDVKKIGPKPYFRIGDRVKMTFLKSSNIHAFSGRIFKISGIQRSSGNRDWLISTHDEQGNWIPIILSDDIESFDVL